MKTFLMMIATYLIFCSQLVGPQNNTLVSLMRFLVWIKHNQLKRDRKVKQREVGQKLMPGQQSKEGSSQGRKSNSVKSPGPKQSTSSQQKSLTEQAQAKRG